MSDLPPTTGNPEPAPVRHSFSFDVVPYRSDGAIKLSSLFQMVAGLIVAGVVLGILCALIGQYFWLIVIFPLAAGALLGGAGVFLIRFLHIRNPWVCAFAGLLAGVFAMLAMHYTNYRLYERNLIENVDTGILLIAQNLDHFKQAIEDPETQDPETLRLIVEQLEADPLGLESLQVQSFSDYMVFEAHRGVQINASKNSDGLNLGFTGTLIYWLSEMLMVAIVALFVMKAAAADPYCVASRRWKKGEAFGPMPDDQAWIDDFKLGRVTTPDWYNWDMPYQLVATLYPSPGHEQEEPADVFLERVTVNKKGEAKRIMLTKLTFPGPSCEVIRQLLSVPQDDTAENEVAEDDFQEPEEAASEVTSPRT